MVSTNFFASKILIRVAFFLVLNFAALGIGGIFTAPGVSSDWYQNLNQAPWTPPGWVFGFAWTTIMICFSVYMAFLWKETEYKKQLISLFGVQWILNIIWNPIFFYFQNVELGLLAILSLTTLVGIFLFYYSKTLKVKSAFILPYFIWLLIASSLNGYILFMN